MVMALVFGFSSAMAELALGRSTLMPGMLALLVKMKITSTTSSTSTKGVILMPPLRLRGVNLAEVAMVKRSSRLLQDGTQLASVALFFGQARSEFVDEDSHIGDDSVGTRRKPVIAEQCRNRHAETGSGTQQRRRHAWRHRVDVYRTGHGR